MFSPFKSPLASHLRTRRWACVCRWHIAGLQVQQVPSSNLKTFCCCCPLFFNQSCILKQWNQMESSQLKINKAGRRVKCWKWCADAQLALDFLKRKASEEVWMCVFYRTWHLPDLNDLLISGKDVQRGCWEIVLTEVKLRGATSLSWRCGSDEKFREWLPNNWCLDLKGYRFVTSLQTLIRSLQFLFCSLEVGGTK